MAGYLVVGEFVVEVPYALTSDDAREIVRTGLSVEGSMHGQQVVKVDIKMVEPMS